MVSTVTKVKLLRLGFIIFERKIQSFEVAVWFTAMNMCLLLPAALCFQFMMEKQLSLMWTLQNASAVIKSAYFSDAAAEGSEKAPRVNKVRRINRL